MPIALGLLLLTGTVACGTPSAPTAPAAVRSRAARRPPRLSPRPWWCGHSTRPVPAGEFRPVAGSALAVLATLPVKGRAPMTGYARTADFGAAWLDVDRNGCDTRNDILRRDLADTTGSGCRVLTGVLDDPYTGEPIDFVRGAGTSTAVQIDHVVALGDAWQTGAQRLSQAKRIDLANDPINLFAVDGPTNERKGDGDAATWLPPNKAFRCTYIAHQVGVKKAYGLWVTPAERCGDAADPRRLPDDAGADLAGVGRGAAGRRPRRPRRSPRRSRRPRRRSPPPSPDMGVVHPGAFCSPAGATGHTAKGTAMICRTSATDSRDRWRSAA